MTPRWYQSLWQTARSVPSNHWIASGKQPSPRGLSCTQTLFKQPLFSQYILPPQVGPVHLSMPCPSHRTNMVVHRVQAHYYCAVGYLLSRSYTAADKRPGNVPARKILQLWLVSEPLSL